MFIKDFLFITLLSLNLISNAHATFQSLGVGGGGAMSGLSISPYNDLWFVGTDMGNLYRSTDAGKTWSSLSQEEVSFDSDLKFASQVGFSADGKTVYWAKGGCYPRFSTDGGVHWKVLSSLKKLLPQDILRDDGSTESRCLKDSNYNRIKYWIINPLNKNDIYAASWDGLYHSNDNGISWEKLSGIHEESLGTFIDVATTPYILYHATKRGIFVSNDQGKSFHGLLDKPLFGFAAGRKANELTLAVIMKSANKKCQTDNTKPDCNHVWVSHNLSPFIDTQQIAGTWLRMANNNSQVIYVSGNGNEDNQGRLTIYKTIDAGKNWSKVFTTHATMRSLQPSAVGVDVGWWDGSYCSFAIHPNNANILGTTGYFFLTVTKEGGSHWLSPYTIPMNDQALKGTPRVGEWNSTGLNPVSVFYAKQHPLNPNILYSGMSDIGCMSSTNHGKSWHMCNVPTINAVYDVGFDNKQFNVVFAAVSNRHDFSQYGHDDIALKDKGGVFRSSDYGRTWKRLTPDHEPFRTAFLSLAIDNKHGQIFAGTRGYGIAYSADNGKNWQWLNSGLGHFASKSSDKQGSLIFPQLQLDPVNGDVYALHSGNRFWDKSSQDYVNETGIYVLKHGEKTWKLLRGILIKLPTRYDGLLWSYPLTFTIDWSDPQRKTMYLVDIAKKNNWYTAGLWKTLDGGKTWRQLLLHREIHHVVIDPSNSKHLLAVGFGKPRERNKPHTSSVLYSVDGGENWYDFHSVPPSYNLMNLQIDALDQTKAFYSSFGGGLFYGPNPLYLLKQHFPF